MEPEGEEKTQMVSMNLDAETLAILKRIDANRTQGIKISVRGYWDSLDPQTPSWYFSKDAIEPMSTYTFLRSIRHSPLAPKYAAWIWRKGNSEVQQYLQEMCNETSPIYVPEILPALKDYVELRTVTEELESMRKERSKIRSDLELYREQEATLQTQVDALEKTKSEYETLKQSYNAEMFKIASYMPFNAVQQLSEFLKTLADLMTPEGNSVFYDPQLRKKTEQVRDMSLSLWDHVNRFDNVDRTATEADQIKSQVLNELRQSKEMLEDKHLIKQLEKLFDQIENMKPITDRYAINTLVSGGWWGLDADEMAKLLKLRTKVKEMMQNE